MKRLLRQKANFDILEGFLSELLREDVVITEILESEGNKESEEGKFNKVDILVKNNSEELMLVEVQNERENDFFHRMNFGQAKLLAEHIREGDDYGKIKKIHSINVVYFDLGHGKDYIYVGSTNFIGMHTNDILELNTSQKEAFMINKVSDIFTTYYLLKVNNFNDYASDTLDEWIYFLKNNEIKDEFKAKGLQKAKEKLRVDNLPKEEKRSYERFLDSKRIEYGVYKSALAEGRSLAMEEINTILEEERRQKEEERRQKEEAKTEEMKMLSLTVQVLHENGMDIKQIAKKLKRPEKAIRKILEK